MDAPDSDQAPFVDRPPGNLFEVLWANARPQPAIPSLMVLFLFVLLPVMIRSQQADPADGDGWFVLLIAAGIVGSCLLSVAAGFCSVFPQVAWFGLAWWCLGLPESAAMPFYSRALMALGMAIAIAMLGYQVWRVRTKRFVPTIRERK
jgi:hypothetical protein